MHWETTRLIPNLHVQIIENNSIVTTVLKEKVDAIWDKKKQIFPNLFNGRVFNVTHLNKNLIQGYWTEYKYVLAQTEDPSLYKDLSIRSLAVIGLIQCPQGFVMGKRTTKSVYLPGYWQSPPAGTVESRKDQEDVDLLNQLYAEAEEELGLHQDTLFDPRIISATEHTDTHIIDVGILLKTNLSFQQIQALWRKNNNPEYDELLCCTHYSELPENTLPTTRYLIKNW